MVFVLHFAPDFDQLGTDMRIEWLERSREPSEERRDVHAQISMYYLYIARCLDNSLYIGVSDNPSKRIVRHNAGLGAKWFLQHGQGVIVYAEFHESYLLAHRRELQLKRWSRVKKERLIRGEKP